MERFLRRRDVVEITGLSRSQIDRLTRAGKFPGRVALGPASSAWVASEVEAWIAARIAERDAPRAA
jgi:prophage regulatory protein